MSTNDEEILKLVKQFGDLESSLSSCGETTKEACAVLARQTKMLDLALDVIIAIATDDTAEFRIRRRLMFALTQIRGIGMPS